MTPEQRSEVEQILQSAMDMPEGERPAYLGEACAGRPAIRAEVESLLAAHGEAGDFIDAVIASEVLQGIPSESPPSDQVASYKHRMAQAGRYDILRELGRGGMGIVYLAKDTLLKRPVAIKSVLPPQGRDQEEWQDMARRLIREAQASGSLDHPNIVRVYDVIQDGDFTSIVMEFVKGMTLAEIAVLGSPTLTALAIGVLKQCAAALDYAHSRGIVHRDIKLLNIMLDETRLVKITDFGVAKVLHSAADLTRGFAVGKLESMASEQLDDLTRGLAVGTLEYMTPEQLEGWPVDGATDQYALAVVAYRMLTGHKIFEAETFGHWRTLILRENPLPASQRNPSLPRAADAVLTRAMSKNAAMRYSSCGQFLMELEQALTAPTLSYAPLDKIVETPMQSKKRARFPAWAMVLGAVVALAAVLGLLAFTLSKIAAKRVDRAAIPPPEEPTDSTVNVKATVNPKDLLNYVWVPSGTFMMGCSPRDNSCEVDERPPHKVNLTKGFWMGQTLVTQEAYQRVRGENPSHFKGANLPVERVTWDNAQAYCRAVRMRLPTEAEWEYAARGGKESRHYGTLKDIAWYHDNSKQTTHAVALLLPNAYGLYDMLGNVWQWVADWYGPYDPDQKNDPIGPPIGTDSNRTLRGGSWDKSARGVRVSDRGKDEPGNRNNDIGFRCVGEKVEGVVK